MKLFETLGIRSPKNIKKEFNALDHEAMFETENDENILDPIIEYVLNVLDGAYVPPE